MNFLINLIKISFYIIVIIIMSGVFKTLLAQTGKPDLIITDVKMMYVKPKHTYNPGSPIRGSDNIPTPTLYVTIKNIGHADFIGAFYIASTNNEQNIKIGRYSNVLLVGNKKDTIKVNESLVVPAAVGGSKYENHFKFFIQTDGKPHYSDALPLVEEENYENNTYEIRIPNYK